MLEKISVYHIIKDEDVYMAKSEQYSKAKSRLENKMEDYQPPTSSSSRKKCLGSVKFGVWR